MAEIVERGDVLFFYRPTVQPADEPITAPSGVQAFYVVLSPAGGKLHRRLRVGRKRMPAPPTDHRKGERFWVRVERVGSFQRVLGDQLVDEVYTTKTRGDRFQPGARPVAQGTYALVRHGDHWHFVYRIDRDEADAPDEVRVPEIGDDVVLFENVRPGKKKPRVVWTTEGGVERLDREGDDLVLVAVGDDPEDVLGLDLALL